MSANVTRLTAQSAADAVYQQEFSVRYDYPVYFTEHLFGQDNPVFARALTRREPAKRHRFVAFVDELPHTATGKLSKRTLREQFRDYRFADAADMVGRD